MAWDSTMSIMLRTLIGDLDAEEYSDSRIKQIIVVSAQYVNNEISFDNDYTMNIVTPNITPDPTTDPQDDGFINLTVLKSACMIDRGNMRLAAMSAGVEARCGPMVMRTLRRMEGYKTLLSEGYCAAYEQSKEQYLIGNASYVRAILSPFTNADFDPAANTIVGIDRIIR